MIPSYKKKTDKTRNVEFTSKEDCFTPEVQQELIDMLAAGNFIETACKAVGVSSRWLRYWRKAYREGNPDALARSEFFEGIDIAIARGEVYYLGKIEDAAKRGDWKAAAWVLSHRHPEHWGDKEVIEIKGVKPNDLSKLTDEELERITSRGKRSSKL